MTLRGIAGLPNSIFSFPQLRKYPLEEWSYPTLHSEVHLILIPRTHGRMMEGQHQLRLVLIGHIQVSKFYLLCLPSTLSLLVNIVTAHPVSSRVVVTVSYGSYKTFNPYWFPGYAGRLARFQQAKKLLDDQVSGQHNYCTGRLILWCWMKCEVSLTQLTRWNHSCRI